MRTYYLILLLCISCAAGNAQEVSFRHLTVEDGLSNNSVMSIYQDERGLMWFGTQDGLNLYDGRHFKVYYQQKDNLNSIPGNKVEQVIGGEPGIIYVRTQNGIASVDVETETFTTISQSKMSCLFYNSKLFAASGNEIVEYSEKRFQTVYKFADNKININCIHIANDSILVGTYFGLYLITGQREVKTLIPNIQISDIFKDSRGDYWICGNRNGMGLYLIQKDGIKNFRCDKDDPSTLISDFTHHCIEDKEGNIWIGTFEGIVRYDRENNRFIRYKKKENPYSLTHSSVWGLYCDNQGTIWAGTYYGGVNLFNPQKQVYQEYSSSLKEEDGLSSGIISRIIEDKKGNLWIGTDGGGINKYDRQKQAYKWYMHGNGKSTLSHNNVKAVYYDEKQDVLWIGTHMGGLNKMELETERFTHYRHQENDSGSLPSDIIMDILPYEDKLLLATHNGITLFNPLDGKSTFLLKDEKDRNISRFSVDLLLDSRGILWIVNLNNGVCSYQFDTRELRLYRHNRVGENSISSNDINSVYEDSQGRLWFCTADNGVDLYNPETGDFKNFDEQRNGLVSNRVYNVCEVAADRLLITTSKGISILDLQTQKCRNYTNLPQVSIKDNALYQTSSDEIFVGGLNGLFSFNKESIKNLTRDYTVFPSRLMVNGVEVSVGDDSGILSQGLPSIQTLTFRPEQNMFSLEYTLSDYLPFNRDKLIYCLEGFSDRWTEMNPQNLITYTNLNPGNYVLVVRAVSDDGVVVSESRIDIVVLPPFYRTIWAYLLYFICMSVLVYYMVNSYKKRIKLQEALKYEKKYIEDVKEMNQAKLRFFTNISHEFRTPLTLIVGHMEMLLRLRSFTPSVYNRILGVYKNCIQMRELITELLDFRKQEQGYMTIKVRRHNIVDFVYEFYLLFQEYAKQRNIDLRFEKSHDDIQVWYDARQMQKVMNNLISNAFKYTKEGGQISISVRNRIQEVIIEITDTGIGISAEDIKNIFDRFYQAEQQASSLSTGTGIGLAFAKGVIELHHGSIEVLSEVNEGTTFSIHLQSGNKHFKKEEICDEDEEIMEKEENESYFVSQYSAFHEIECENEESSDLQKKYKLLIVEDNESLKEMLTKILEPFYIVTTASDGEEGLEQVRTCQPDLIISDVLMPKMSGIELCRAIKKDIDLCHIPVVLLTARTAVEHTVEGLKIGADDYITKPFNIDILISRCNNLINNRMMLQEKFSRQPQIAPQILATNDMDKVFVDKVMRIVEEHLDDMEFSVDLFAREMGVARTKLFTKMKAVTGQTPLDFILTIRLKRAAVMLRNNPELSISEIADRLGFGSPRHFTKCFKERYNTVPQAYRKRKDEDDSTLL